MATINCDTTLTKKDSIHKIWKYLSSRPIIKSGEFGMQSIDISMQSIDILDLTNRDSLFYILEKNKEKTPRMPYKIIDNAIIVQNQDKESQIEFKITELTANELKLIVHASYKNKDGKKVDVDLLEMTFEEKNE